MDINNFILEQSYILDSKIRYAKFFKVDFHIHTPGSKKDYKVNEKYYEHVTKDELIDMVKVKQVFSEEQLKFINFDELGKDYITSLLILHEAYETKKLDLIVITDHNTIDFYPIISSVLNDYLKTRKEKRSFVVLPGVEITCFNGTHMIAIFRKENYEKQWDFLKYELDVDINFQAESEKQIFSTKSEIDVINSINKVNGIAYIPHADNSSKDTIKSMLKPLSGSSKIELFRNRNLHAIGLRNYSLRKELEKSLENKSDAYYRKYPVAYLTDSDAHDIDKIGTSPMYIKMEKLDFESLKFALEDPKTRVTHLNKSNNNSPYIKGLVVRGGYLSQNEIDWSYYPFCKNLNCIIGGRGTGKSTILNCLISCLTGKTHNTQFRDFISSFESLLIFINKDEKDYCIYCKPSVHRDLYSGLEINIYGDTKKNISCNIENWLNLYEINHSKAKCYKKNKAILYEMQNYFNAELFTQTEILNIGTKEEDLSKFIHNIITRTSDGTKYENLLNNYRTCIDSINNFSFNNVELIINNDSKLHLIENEIYNIINNQISQINNSLINKTKIEVIRKNAKLEIYNCIIQKVEDECINNTYDLNKIIRVLTYLNNKYSLVDLISSLNYRYDDILKEIQDNGLTKGTTFNEANYSSLNDNEILGFITKTYRSNFKFILKKRQSFVYRISFNTYSYDNINSKKENFVSIEKLSYGQRAVAILSIVIDGLSHLNINTPLIIDQPEDQLDNQFIYKHLISNIRQLKDIRQIIFVTHNPNIPVSGDAETVICMKSNDTNGWMHKIGSIDNKQIREEIVNILEGGTDSLKLRISKYKISN